MSIILYSTSGCHLCELAEQLLAQSSLGYWQVMDITESESLVKAYGTKIPVLASPEKPRYELEWPFDIDTLERWLTEFNKI